MKSKKKVKCKHFWAHIDDNLYVCLECGILTNIEINLDGVIIHQTKRAKIERE